MNLTSTSTLGRMSCSLHVESLWVWVFLGAGGALYFVIFGFTTLSSATVCCI